MVHRRVADGTGHDRFPPAQEEDAHLGSEGADYTAGDQQCDSSGGFAENENTITASHTLSYCMDISIFLMFPIALPQARQSRSHRFEIADKESMRVLDLTITIVYQGNFGTKGYKMGRLAASLFRLPDEKDPNSSPLPLPVGYCPYHLQSPNLPELLGRVVIIHRPRQRPIKPCIFQLVVGCASNTKYSIQVSARYAQTALPLVDKFIEEARIHQSRLPICLKELDVSCKNIYRLAVCRIVAIVHSLIVDLPPVAIRRTFVAP